MFDEEFEEEGDEDEDEDEDDDDEVDEDEDDLSFVYRTAEGEVDEKSRVIR